MTCRSRWPGGTGLKHSLSYLVRLHGCIALKPRASFSCLLLRSFALLHSVKAQASFSCWLLRSIALLHSAKAQASFSCRLLWSHGYVALKPELALAVRSLVRMPTWYIPTSTSTYTSYQRHSSRHTSTTLPTPATRDAHPDAYPQLYSHQLPTMFVQPHTSKIWSTSKYPLNHLATLPPSIPLPTNITNLLIWDLTNRDLIRNFTLFVNTTNKLSPVVIIVTLLLFASLSFGCSYSHA